MHQRSLRGAALVALLAASACAGGAPSGGSVERTAPTTTAPALVAPASLPPPAAASPPACVGEDPGSHVYRPERLIALETCRSVTGVVVGITREADGDWHVQLRLDLGQETLLNAANLSQQGGNLVLRIVCANPTSEPDAAAACAGYVNAVPVPSAGAWIRVAGPLVRDATRGWDAIHPVWSVTFLGSVVTNAPTPSGAGAAVAAPASTSPPPPLTPAPVATPTSSPSLATKTATPSPGATASPSPSPTPTPTPSPAPTPTPSALPTPAASYVLVGTWSGSVPANTETFTVSVARGPWRIRWTNSVCQQELVIRVHQSPAEILDIIDVTCQASGTVYEYRGGTYYLGIDAFRTNWTVTVEQAQ